jgi:putative beta-lysine N-acetyltransferase
MKLLKNDDMDALAGLYSKVFATYPFPVYDPAFLRSALSQGVVYFGAVKRGELLGAAACEVDVKSRSAEMTDFAVEARARGLGLSRHLLAAMEEKMQKTGILTLFTIARTLSHGMNLSFAKAGYGFSGSLVNNTNISGGIESMNVWFKRIVD